MHSFLLRMSVCLQHCLLEHVWHLWQTYSLPRHHHLPAFPAGRRLLALPTCWWAWLLEQSLLTARQEFTNLLMSGYSMKCRRQLCC